MSRRTWGCVTCREARRSRLLLLATNMSKRAISGKKKKIVSGVNDVDRHSRQTRYYMTASILFFSAYYRPRMHGRHPEAKPKVAFGKNSAIKNVLTFHVRARGICAELYLITRHQHYKYCSLQILLIGRGSAEESVVLRNPAPLGKSWEIYIAE